VQTNYKCKANYRTHNICSPAKAVTNKRKSSIEVKYFFRLRTQQTNKQSENKN